MFIGGIIGWIVLGLVVGLVASRVVNLKGDDPRLGIALGVAGGVLGGWLYTAISGATVSAFDVWGLLAAAVGAALASATWHLVRSRSAPIEYQNRRYR